ncbi:MAG: hypothetical protein KGI37_07595 [Alphaproteobacteria bacterium]|nr:hypothetical protein [Alphaproteobacteria bacterium]
MNHFMSTMPIKRPTFPLPPPEARTMAQRVHAANEAWIGAEDAARSNMEDRNALNGMRMLMHLSSFAESLIDDAELRRRFVQYIDVKLRAEYPAQTGRML